jgi:hypothetical protein
LKTSAAIGTAILGETVFPFRFASAGQPTVIDLGSRRELFVDDFLIERLTGGKLTPHKPEAKDVALVCDAPWEGNTSAYYAIFPDGDRVRMYYRGSHFEETKKKHDPHPQVTCYAESKDGITWTKPKLGLFEFKGSKDNNIVWMGTGTHNFTPFLDLNPAASPDARYKALAGGKTMIDGKSKNGLNALKSPDGIHWTMMAEGVITAGAFDSQNLAFWDSLRGEYRAYWRIFTAGHTDERGWKPAGVRAIRTATSKDFIHWESQADLTYVDSPTEHLYTNAIQPYFRAPYLFIGFPTRFQPKTQQVEPVFMTSRDGVLFRRWPEELIPITAPKDRDGNRSNYMAHGLIAVPGNPRELSVYGTEAYYKGPASRVRRFTFRTDGFVSVHASAGAELLTKPLQFTGKTLELNCCAGGSVRVEIQDVAGNPLPSFLASDCQPITGDQIACTVTWKSGADLGSLAGKPVRLRFILENADLYALQFRS